MIRELKSEYPAFVLDTAHTTYVLRVMPAGQIEHVYYGRKIRLDSAAQVETIAEKHAYAPGNSNLYDEKHTNLSLEDVMLETSGVGKGDVREPMVELVAPDGSTTTDFTFLSATITKGKRAFHDLPGSYDEKNQQEQLMIALKDQNHGYVLELYYWVYTDCDVITRAALLRNTSDKPVTIERLLSYSLDLNEAGLGITTFHGGWTKEMHRYDVQLTAGRFVNDTRVGASSNRSNPFFMVSRPDANEDQGDVFGFNLIYSGNHYEACEVSSFHKTRICGGINPNGFSWILGPDEEFETPEAVMTFSPAGYNGMSHHMHDFVRNHIVRGNWAHKDRPVLMNSWEASYFNISEGSLLKLAKASKEAGIELFVMDDGWFGTRNDDKQSLGDWDVNRKKLPHGLKGLCDKINALGMDFGIWVEPEMVNVNSNLYRAHPDWAMAIPGMNHSEGRNQRVLDLANPQVAEYITEKMTEVFSSANIRYVKWDMNRIFSDVYSPYLPVDRQQETAHRYMLGLYRMMQTLTERFPDILFEGCASGGNRFDLGILSYFPQIWASDNSDAISRLSIQTGYSYGYPQSTYTAHVSACPNHQTLRVTPADTRFNVASFGVLGYECNLAEMSSAELKQVKAEVAVYKKYRHTLQYGQFYRGRGWGNVWEWNVVSEDGRESVGMLSQKELLPGEPYLAFWPRGLQKDLQYHFFNTPEKIDIRVFGSLINQIAPIHVKEGGVVHNTIAHFVKMDGEQEDYKAYGDVMMYGGIQLKQSYVGTGFDSNVRYLPDYGSRMYFMEAEEKI